MSIDPEISVIIPAHNSGDQLANALESVFAQTFRRFEVVVVDDGSTDDTPEIAGKFPRVRVIRQVCRGPAAARNTGLAHSTAPLVAFLDADDLWMPEKLDIQYRYLQAHPEVGLVYSDLATFDQNGVLSESYDTRHRRIYEGEVFDRLLLKNFIGTITVMTRRCCFDRAGIFDETLARSSDWHQWLRIAFYYKIGYINRPLAKYRWNPGSVSYDSVRAYPDRLRVIDDIVTRFPEYFASRKLLLRRARGGCLFRYGYMLFHAGRSREAAAKLAAAAAQAPWLWKAYLYLLGLLLPGTVRRRLTDIKIRTGLRLMPSE